MTTPSTSAETPMNILDFFKGKEVYIHTDMGDIKLTIESVKEETRYIETGPSTAANDWYPDGYHDTTYRFTFTNGKSKSFRNLTDIKFVP